MALYSFITKKCNSDLQKHGLVDTVRKYAAKIESDQSTGSIDLYPPPLLKKNIRRHFRLIIEERRVGEDIVYCFLRVFQRSDPEYSQFMNLSNQGQVQLFTEKYGPSSDGVLAYLYERRTQNRVEPLPALSQAEHTYLMGLSNTQEKTEQSIVESHTWVERISTNIGKESRIEYFKLLDGLLWEGTLNPTQTVVGNGNYWILYRYFPKIDKVFLVAPLEPRFQEKDEANLRSLFEHIFNANERTADHLIRQEGLRSYPSIITADKDLWLDIQESKEANLSLSPEEMDVLNSVLKPTSTTSGERDSEVIYPLFINGRPGSGKSTILLYLFAEHLHFHLKLLWGSKTGSKTEALERSPIYLTYSESLLNDAKRIVFDILRCDSKKAQASYDLNDVDIKKAIENSFGNFRAFLRTALPVTQRHRYESSNFVDYPHFRRVFKEKFSQGAPSQRKNLSPEIAWHVIRTYIKGMRQESSSYLDVEAYEHELPRKQQMVTRTTFEIVYTEVWEKFYKTYCESEGYWDDQDLARELLDLAQSGRIELSQFPAVFCDESQDFTKVELEVVFQLSRYSKRSIKMNELHSVLPRIPFAFAGDPFQTLNPTGFDWSATKAFFHNTIVRPLDPAGRADLRFNYQELEFNYRSSQKIVQFCNLIQLMRGRAFDIKHLKPQKSWQVHSGLAPVHFDISQTGCQQAMQSQQSLIYIIPCQEGEEETYIKRDAFLKRIAWDEKEQKITRDVFSPIRVKGLQFQRVVLYKFGEHALNTYPNQINLFLDPILGTTRKEAKLSKEETLPLEYFVNHLYVAASRPCTQLIIADTRKALDDFWAFAIEGNQQALLYSYQSREDWHQEHITRLTEGTKESWEQVTENALTLGNEFYERGQETRDPYFLERARQNYHISGAQELGDKAFALKLYYEGKLKEAGEVYVRLKQFNNALGCFWKTRSYEEIVRLQAEIISKSPSHLLVVNTAKYMTGDQNIEASLLCIERIHNIMSLDKEIERSIPTDPHWTLVVQETIQQLAVKIGEESEPQITSSQWKKTWSQITGILNAGIVLSDTISLARIACIAQEYTTSKMLLVENEISPTSATDWIIRVYAETAEFPDNIRWFSQLDLYQRIIESYESSLDEAFHDKSLTERDAARIFSAYINEEEFLTARTFLRRYPSEKRYLNLILSLVQQERYHLANQIALDLIQLYVQRAEWDEALQFITPLPVLPVSLSGQTKQLLMDPAKGHAYFIRCLARSQALQRELSLSQRHAISKYLRTQLSNPSKSLQENLLLHEAGAAFERAGIFDDTLNFYESIVGQVQDNNSKLVRWAQLRWVKTKFLQSSSTDDELSRTQCISIASDKLKTWNIPKNKIQTAPKYPRLEPLGNYVLPVEEILVPEISETPVQATLQNEEDIALEPPQVPDSVLSEEINSPAISGSLPTWRDIPGYTNSAINKPAEPINTLQHTEDASLVPVPQNGESIQKHSSTSDNTGDFLPAEIKGEESIEPQLPLISDSSTEAKPDSKEVLIKASLQLQAETRIFECLIIQPLRILELREHKTLARIDILSNAGVVRDSYEMLTIEKQISENSLTQSWFIKEWSLLIKVEQASPLNKIELLHEPSGKALIRLLL